MVFFFSLVSVCDKELLFYICVYMYSQHCNMYSVNVQKIALFIFKVQGETENFLPEAFVEMRIL